MREAAWLGDPAAAAAALDLEPGIVGEPGPHPRWGGRPAPLQLAAERGRVEIARLLLERGADVEGGIEGYGWSPLQLAAHRCHRELAELLRADVLDLAFLYRSTAVQNNLAFLDLPPQISLGEMPYREGYSQATLRITGAAPDSMAEISGVPIRYGVVLTRESSPWAERYLNYLLSPEVQALYRKLGYRNVPITEIPPW